MESEDLQDQKAALQKYAEPTFFGYRHGWSGTSLCPNLFGQVQYQCEGSRLVATVQFEDLMAFEPDDFPEKIEE